MKTAQLLVNTIEAYQKLGEKTAMALRKRDRSMFNHFHDTFRRMMVYEDKDLRSAVKEAFDKGYKSISQFVSY